VADEVVAAGNISNPALIFFYEMYVGTRGYTYKFYEEVRVFKNTPVVERPRAPIIILAFLSFVGSGLSDGKMTR
jgi:hypothetical protein